MKLTLHELRKSYDGHSVLKALNLQIEETRSLALIGPSGGGKSTLLRLLAGLEKPESGRILINDTPIPDKEELRRTYRQSIGIVFQSFNLFPHLSALENICLPLQKVHGKTRTTALRIAAECLDRFKLADHRNKRPAELSGGQNQRVAIARAISHDPDILFFDEPTSALDPEMTGEVLDSIESLIKRGKSCIVVTHQMGFAKRACDDVALLHHGEIAEHGKCNDVFNTPQNEVTKSFLSRILRY